MLFSQAIDKFTEWRYLQAKKGTNNGYNFALRSLCVFLRNPQIEDITLDNVMEWFELQSQIGWNPNGFLVKSIAIRKILEFYRDQGLKVLNPYVIPIPETEYVTPRVINEEEYKALLDVIPKDRIDPRHIRNEAIIRMLWDTGARNSEIRSLDVQDMDTQNMKAVIRTKKARSRVPMRQIFWTESTNEVLKGWLMRRERICTRDYYTDPAVFIGVSGKKCGERIGNAGVGQMLKRYSRKAEIFPIVNAHSFRHRFGQDLAEKEMNNSTISSLMGHSSLVSSFRYTMLSDRAKERVYRKCHPGDQGLGECPARRFEAPPALPQKRDWRAELALREIKKAQREGEYMAIKEKEKITNI